MGRTKYKKKHEPIDTPTSKNEATYIYVYVYEQKYVYMYFFIHSWSESCT